MNQLRALRVFDKVVADGSFAAAARALDLTPPVVTRLVAELESHLGVRLLNRTTRRVALTPAGVAYLVSARRVLAELDDADALAGTSSRQPRGLLRVLCPPAFAVHQLALHLPRFRAMYPQLALEVSAIGPVVVADEQHDVSIVSVGQQVLQGDFVARKLARSTFVMCASPAYLDRRGRPGAPEDLLTHEGLLPAVSAVRRQLTLYRDDPSAGADVEPSRVVQLPLPRAAVSSAQIEFLLAGAVAGLGIAGLPSFAASAGLRDGLLERVLPQWRGSALTLYAAMPTRRQVPLRTRLFFDFLVETFGGSDRDPWLDPPPV